MRKMVVIYGVRIILVRPTVSCLVPVLRKHPGIIISCCVTSWRMAFMFSSVWVVCIHEPLYGTLLLMPT